MSRNRVLVLAAATILVVLGWNGTPEACAVAGWWALMLGGRWWLGRRP